MSDSTIISLEGVSRSYEMGGETVSPLRCIDWSLPKGKFVAIVGRSGSGKTTLLNIMGGLDLPTDGKVFFEGSDLSLMNQSELLNIRRHKVGFVFQSFGLLPLLSAYENIELPLRISGLKAGERKKRSLEALDLVGLTLRSQHRPYELSGGEQQRVAIARALAKDPILVLADEPTGELDSLNAHAIFKLFKEMVLDRGISVVAVTHDSTLIALADVVLELRNGMLIPFEGVVQRYRE